MLEENAISNDEVQEEITTHDTKEDNEYEITYKRIMGDISDILEREGIESYVVITKHDINDEFPMLLMSDDKYEVTKLLARLHRSLKQEIINEIS